MAEMFFSLRNFFLGSAKVYIFFIPANNFEIFIQKIMFQVFGNDFLHIFAVHF